MKSFIKISVGIVSGILVIIISMSAIIGQQKATVYYVDSVAGNDNNRGTSKASPWKSINIVNNHTFKPGDKILFKAGCGWNESLTLRGSGTCGNPIVIDMYDKGNKPVIVGQSKQSIDVVRLSNLEYWEINNLDISSIYAINGIYVEGGTGILNHIYIRNCEIHHMTVGGGYSKGNGIRISGRNRFNDIRIENNYFHDLSGDGFIVNGDANSGNITNLYVANNSVINAAGDGIVIRDAYKAITEYNYVNNCGYMTVSSHAGIWCAFTDSAIFQYNECCNVKKPSNNNDGMSFDSDLGSTHTIFQYNYSHDNDGGFHLSMSRDMFEIIRYNISQNDQFRLFFQGFPAPTCLIYNNIFYGPAVLSNRTSLGGTWYNNIFWSTGAYYSFNSLGSNNITWGNATGGKHVDPKLVNTGNSGTGIDMKDVNRLSGYKLQKESPCIDAGFIIPNNGSRDFWGNALYKGLPDIGVMEFDN